MDKQRFDKINNRPVWGQAGDPPNVLFSNIGRQSISEQIRQAVWLSDFMLEPRFWPEFIIFRFKIIYRLMVNTHLHYKIFDILQNFQNMASWGHVTSLSKFKLFEFYEIDLKWSKTIKKWNDQKILPTLYQNQGHLTIIELILKMIFLWFGPIEWTELRIFKYFIQT